MVAVASLGDPRSLPPGRPGGILKISRMFVGGTWYDVIMSKNWWEDEYGLKYYRMLIKLCPESKSEAVLAT